jgi:hypothetical protein
MKKTFTYIALIVFGAVLSFGVQTVYGQPRHPHLHLVLDELRDAKVELEKERHDWGGHRDKAIGAIEAARHEIVEVLKYER